MKVTLMAVILFFVASGRYCSAEHNGLELNEECSAVVKSAPQADSQVDAFRRAMCIGLVRGVMESMMLVGAVDKDRSMQKLHGCIPTVMPLEAIKVVMKFLDDHPERLHEPDTVLIMSALSTTYPCK